MSNYGEIKDWHECHDKKPAEKKKEPSVTVGEVVGNIFKWIGISLLVLITLGLALIWVISAFGETAAAATDSHNDYDRYW